MTAVFSHAQKEFCNVLSSVYVAIFGADIEFKAKKRSQSPDNAKGISIANAKYSSEDAAVLVQYTIAIVEYTRHCGPLKASLERMHELQREIEENERIQKEKEEQVGDNWGCLFVSGNKV